MDWRIKCGVHCSTFDTDPFEPQPDGVGTIFPFWVGSGTNDKGFVEYLHHAQDFTLFILMKHENIDIWKSWTGLHHMAEWS